jgi:energy-coupling factor transport system ATP-binding protein
MNENMVLAKNLDFQYRHDNREIPVTALSNINISIKEGQFVAVLGRNGSGKSTLARLMNSLLLPTNGTLYVKGMNTKNDELTWEVRRTVGMIFQNPDNQIVGTIVEEDIAFGPENLGFRPEEIRKRVNEAMKTTGILKYAKQAPHFLSGGQKQRVAIAGILAMKPECIILDEATSMLDPSGRKEVMDVIEKLNKNEGITIIDITHNVEEAIYADRIIILDEGKIELDGKPADVLSKVDNIKKLGLEVPQVTELFHELNAEGYKLPVNVINIHEAAVILKNMLMEAENVNKG